MSGFSKREAAYVERLKQNKVDLQKQVSRLGILVKVCYAAAALLAGFALFVFFVIGETPRIYHGLVLASIFIIILALCVDARHARPLVLKLLELQRNGIEY